MFCQLAIMSRSVHTGLVAAAKRLPTHLCLQQGQLQRGDLVWDGVRLSHCINVVEGEHVDVDRDGYVMCDSVPSGLIAPALCHVCTVTRKGQNRLHGERVTALIAARRVAPPGAPPAPLAMWSLLGRPATRGAWTELLLNGITPNASHRCHNKR